MLVARQPHAARDFPARRSCRETMPCLPRYRCRALAFSSLRSGVPSFSFALPLPEVRQAVLGAQPQGAHQHWRPRSWRLGACGHSVHGGSHADAIRLAGTQPSGRQHLIFRCHGARSHAGLKQTEAVMLRSPAATDGRMGWRRPPGYSPDKLSARRRQVACRVPAFSRSPNRSVLRQRCLRLAIHGAVALPSAANIYGAVRRIVKPSERNAV